MGLMLPDLHDRLVEAAERPPARAPQLLRQLAPVVASVALVLAFLAVVMSLAGTSAPQEPAGANGSVPEATIAKAEALSRAPADAPPTGPLDARDMRTYVAALLDELPYPPAATDDLQSKIRPFRSFSPPYKGEEMAAVDDASDARRLGEYRAQCIWQEFWLRSTGPDRAAATRVLATVPKWPTIRGSEISERARSIARAAAAADPAPMTAETKINCRGT